MATRRWRIIACRRRVVGVVSDAHRSMRLPLLATLEGDLCGGGRLATSADSPETQIAPRPSRDDPDLVIDGQRIEAEPL